MTPAAVRPTVGSLRQSGIADASPDVVRTAACILGSLRRTFESQQCLEVITPVLQGVSPSPLVQPLQVTLGDERVSTRSGIARRAENQAELSTVPGGFLQALLPSVGNVYTIAPMFRGELVPTWLTEFRYVQVAARGGLEDAMKMAQTLIGNAIEAVQKANLPVSERAKNYAKPVQMTYPEAVKAAGGRLGESLSHDQYRDLAATNGDRPVIIRGVPLEIEPYGAIGAQMSNDGPAFFEVVVPDAGELGAGKQHESNVETFWKHADGAQARRIGQPWHNARDLEVIGELLGRLPAPSYTFGLGFERLTQYIVGARDVGEAVAYPVINGGRFRVPVRME